MADNVYNLKFTLSNGDVIDAGQITAPQGPKGDKGDSATIDANTLNGLLSGSNGIAIAKNAAGDKVEAKLAIPETGPITLASTHVPRPAILINVEQGGPPHAGGISCSREVGGETTYVGPAGIMIDDGAYVLSINNTNDSFIAYTDIHGMPLGDVLMGGGPKGNVKTLFGNQSIYGSGNIDLYKHNVIISQGSTESDRMCVYCQILSSNNLNINSLTNFQTIVKDANEFIPATGKLKLYNGDAGSIIGGVCKAGAIEYNIRGKYTNNIDFSSGWGTINSVGGLTFYDTVTTV
jgi:hypothetical protein